MIDDLVYKLQLLPNQSIQSHRLLLFKQQRNIMGGGWVAGGH